MRDEGFKPVIFAAAILLAMVMGIVPMLGDSTVDESDHRYPTELADAR